jgi:prepilin-type N-terminal cleavage/methylation domain-containing protein
MSTSERPVPGSSRGFTLIELLVGLALTVCIAVAVAPLWLSLERAGATEADRTVQSLQGRVAVARFERDLRLASASGCPFALESPVLEASDSQVVLLDRSAEGDVPIIVEWEIVSGALMRRWGFCPSSKPVVYRHSLYRDHKTMLEGVTKASAFSYVLNGESVTTRLEEEDLGSIEAVVLEGWALAQGGGASIEVSTTARVAR